MIYCPTDDSNTKEIKNSSVRFASEKDKMMKNSRCPYHVKQGIVDGEGKFVLSDVCGLRSANGAGCTHVPFHGECHKTCSRFLAFTRGTEKQIVLPKNDIEYLPELNNGESFSEFELL